jgi:hypothetical protein
MSISPILKPNALPGFVQELDRLERQSDKCYQGLELLRYPENLAGWAVLTRFVQIIESTIADYGQYSPQMSAVMINLGRSGALLLEWIQEHALRKLAPISRFRWNHGLNQAAAKAFDTAYNYETFRGSFPAWHRSRVVVELRGRERIRFSRIGSPQQHRVTAFQQGFRANPQPSSRPAPASPVPDTPQVREWNRRVLQACKKTGRNSFAYDPPVEYYQLLRGFYEVSLDSQCRRNESVNLGTYTLKEFKRFYSALLSVCSVHEVLCYWWGLEHGYPIDSAVLVRQRRNWVELVSRLTSLTAETTDAILTDLTLTRKRSVDIFVHPFIRFGQDSLYVMTAPQFPLKSRADENILRTCSYLNPTAYNAISQLKEEEMRRDLTSELSPGFAPRGPVVIPEAGTDLDFVLEDIGSSAVLLAELKWVRKPSRPLERFDRDSDFLKGVKQLRSIETFLRQNPRYLVERGILSKSLADFSKVQFMLIARDHFIWLDPADDYPVVEHETFKKIVREGSGLRNAVDQMLTFDWLPIEKRDFEIRYEVAHANGVSIETEIFYPVSRKG